MNGTMLQGFSWYLDADGQHWHRIAEDARVFADTGITAVWLPPAYKGMDGPNEVGYAVYDTYDLGEFDQKGSVRTKYGTKEDYLKAIHAIKAAGMEALADIVLDHRMGSDGTEEVRAVEVDPQDREKAIGDPRTIEAWTRYTFPGRKGRYSDFTWNHDCFHGVDFDERTKHEGIFLFEGKHWSEQVDHSENGNYDYLMGADVDEMDPAVYQELLRWGKWYLDTCDLDGFRLDACKHMDRQFYLQWLPALRAYSGKELFTVGEYWSHDVSALKAYLGPERIMSLFDVPLHFQLYSASTSGGYFDLSRIFDGTLVSEDPTRCVTFVENHDTQPGQALQSFVEPWFKPSAYALILLREAGYPCVFYGDLFGMPNDGNIPAVRELPLLMELRRRFAYGVQHDYLDDRDVIGWTREGVEAPEGTAAERAEGPLKSPGLACVLTDSVGGTKHMYVGPGHEGERWICVLGPEDAVTVGPDGCADFTCRPGGCSVYLPELAAGVVTCDFVHAVNDVPADLRSYIEKRRAEEEKASEGPDAEGANGQGGNDEDAAGGDAVSASDADEGRDDEAAAERGGQVG